MNHILSLIICLCLFVATVFGQVGGTGTYQFLTLQPNARIAALGGTAITLDDNDMNLAIQNPSLLRSGMDNQITYNHVFLFQDIGAGYVGFAKQIDSVGTFSFGIQYIGYGDFKRTTAAGEDIGTFSAGEYAANVGYGKKLSDYFSVGGQVKLIYSSMAEYASVGISTDIATTYHNENKLFTAAVVISNVGRQITEYSSGNNEELPFNAQLAFSKKFQHNPFRFTVVANHLEKAGKLLYTNNERPGLKKSLETGEVIPETFNVGEKTLAHLTFGSEVLLGKTFYIALAYNHYKRWEMKLEELGGFAGFSWGFGFKVKKIQVAYGNTGYYVGHGTNHFSFIFNLNDFRKKKRNSAS
ncbi:MAG: type IX secretion system protein PorQ [Bacteroidota bacterium]